MYISYKMNFRPISENQGEFTGIDIHKDVWYIFWTRKKFYL
jgi:hypothetical protein